MLSKIASIMMEGKEGGGGGILFSQRPTIGCDDFYHTESDMSDIFKNSFIHFFPFNPLMPGDLLDFNTILYRKIIIYYSVLNISR